MKDGDNSEENQNYNVELDTKTVVESLYVRCIQARGQKDGDGWLDAINDLIMIYTSKPNTNANEFSEEVKEASKQVQSHLRVEAFRSQKPNLIIDGNYHLLWFNTLYKLEQKVRRKIAEELNISFEKSDDIIQAIG